MRSRSYLTDLVAARIDVLIPSGNNVGGQTSIEASYPKIEEELDLSAWHILQTAPEHLLYQVAQYDKKHFHKEVDADVVADVDTRAIIANDLSVTIPLPDNFLRFIRAKMSGWGRDVIDLISSNDPKYNFQFNKFTASSGNSNRPVAAVVPFSSYVSAEQTKRTIAQTLTVNQVLTALFNGETPAGFSLLATNEIIILNSQTDTTQNGTYKVNAAGEPTKLTHETTTVNRGMALQCFRAKTSTDTLEELFYVPKLKAEQLPDEFTDALVDETAYRVLRTMGPERAQEAQAAREASMILLNSMKVGLQGEV
jgi:hypothetical protein